MVRTRCPHCKGKLEGRERIHEACIAPWADAQAQKAERRAAKASKAAQAEEKRQDRVKREGMKTIPVLLRAAQKAFNAWVRERDAHLPCISCGAPPPDPTAFHGGRDAGHYRSVGAAGHLRFHEGNVHGQCVHCNQFLAGNVVGYRLGLIARYGLPHVEALEADNTAVKWAREALIDKMHKYIRLRKELRKKLENS